MTMRNTMLADIAAREDTPNITFEPPTPCLMISPMTPNQGLRIRENQDEIGIHTSFNQINSLTNRERERENSESTSYSTINDDIFAWQESVQSLSPAPSPSSRPASVSSWSFCGSSISGGDDSSPLEIAGSSSPSRATTSTTTRNSLSVSPSQSGKTKVSHARKRAPGHVSRPRNAFILFRSHAINNLIPTSLGVKDARAVSCIVASLWNSLPEEDKKEWRAVAQREKIEHQMKYPDYRFKPDTNSSANFKPRQHAKTEEAVKEQCGIIADQILRAHGRSSSAKSDCGVITKKLKKVASATTMATTTPRNRKTPVRGVSRALLTVPTSGEEESVDDAEDKGQMRLLRRHISAPQLGDYKDAPPIYTEQDDEKMPLEYHYDTWQQSFCEEQGNHRCASPASYIFKDERVLSKLEALDMTAINETPLFIDTNQDSVSPEDVLARMYSNPLIQVSDQVTLHDTLVISPKTTSFQDVHGGIAAWQNWPLVNEAESINDQQEMEYHRSRQDTSSSSLDGVVAISSLAAASSINRLDPMLSSDQHNSNVTRLFHHQYTNEKLISQPPLDQMKALQDLYELAQKDEIRNYRMDLQQQQQQQQEHERHWSEDSNLEQTLMTYNEDEANHSAQMEANLSSWVHDSM